MEDFIIIFCALVLILSIIAAYNVIIGFKEGEILDENIKKNDENKEPKGDIDDLIFDEYHTKDHSEK